MLHDGGSSPSELDGGTLPIMTGLGTPPPIGTGWGTRPRDWMGYAPVGDLDGSTPSKGMDDTWTGYAVGGTSHAVSRRRILLLLEHS